MRASAWRRKTLQVNLQYPEGPPTIVLLEWRIILASIWRQARVQRGDASFIVVSIVFTTAVAGHTFK